MGIRVKTTVGCLFTSAKAAVRRTSGHNQNFTNLHINYQTMLCKNIRIHLIVNVMISLVASLLFTQKL